ASYTVSKDKVKKALDEYEARLKNQGPARRAALIHEMASINSPDVVGVLVRHLAESDTAVRRSVIQQLDAGEAELSLVLLQGLTDLLLQVRMRDVLERSTLRLVTLFEASEAVSK